MTPRSVVVQFELRRRFEWYDNCVLRPLEDSKKINLLGYQYCWILGRNSATGICGRQTGPECRQMDSQGRT